MTIARVCAATAMVMALTGCGLIKSPEDRMKDGCGDKGNGSTTSVLDLRTGMPRADAVKTLKCYDSDAALQGGTMGAYYGDVNKFLKQIDPDGSGYGNILVWTRGEERPCPTNGTSSSDLLSESIKPDDERFSAMVTGGRNGNGFKCFKTIKDHIVLRLAGPPEEQTVVGIWRLTLPADGRRPMMSDLAQTLGSKYPAVVLPEGALTAGFWATGFQDPGGNALNAAQIYEDYRSLKAPVEPLPLNPTKPCGFLGLGSCPREPTQAEINQYEAATAKYKEDIKSYQPRRDLADKFGPCVSNPPRTPGVESLNEGVDNGCGPSFFVAASPYPGGFAESIYVGVYDPAEARRGRVKLEAYLRSRGGGPANSQTPAL